jgi:hypothetical protein
MLQDIYTITRVYSLLLFLPVAFNDYKITPGLDLQ